MPVYLLHGFRWPREGFTGIRVHVVMHNLEDVSVEYIQNENSKQALLESFRTLFPDIMAAFDGSPGRELTFLEQYDPTDLYGENVVSQPYAFVGDRVVTLAAGPGNRTGSNVSAAGARVLQAPKEKEKPRAYSNLSSPRSTNVPTPLSVSVEEVIAEGPGFTAAAWEALADLRDKIAEKEKIGWWVIYNGDPERRYDELQGSDGESIYSDDEAIDEEDAEDDSREAEGHNTEQQRQEQDAVASRDASEKTKGKGRALSNGQNRHKQHQQPQSARTASLDSAPASSVLTALPIREERQMEREKPTPATPVKSVPAAPPAGPVIKPPGPLSSSIPKTESLKKRFFRKKG